MSASIDMQGTFSEKLGNEETLTRVKINDEKVLKEVYSAHYPAILRYILANQGSSSDAKDIYQEAFLAFWRNVQLDKFRAEHPQAIGSYLMRIAKNKWIDVLRKEKRLPVSPLEGKEVGETNATAVNTEEEQYLQQVKGHYRKMGEPCKELLYRFYFRKEMLRQIATHFSWTEATAKNNKYRCLQKLRDAVLNKS